jgi:hypothetical protein
MPVPFNIRIIPPSMRPIHSKNKKNKTDESISGYLYESKNKNTIIHNAMKNIIAEARKIDVTTLEKSEN